MKPLFILLLLILTSCGRQSSPEGRSLLRDEQIQAEIDLLKKNDKVLLDSIKLIHRELNTIKQPKID